MKFIDHTNIVRKEPFNTLNLKFGHSYRISYKGLTGNIICDEDGVGVYLDGNSIDEFVDDRYLFVYGVDNYNNFKWV